MASSSLKMSFMLFCFSFILFVTAFVSPWWKDAGGDSEGLWLKCEKPNYAYWECTANLTNEETLIATQVLMSLAMGCYLVIMMIYIVCLRDETRDIRVASIAGFVAVICQVAGLLVYGVVRYFWSSGLLSWCFILAASSCGIVFLNSLVMYFTQRPVPFYKKLTSHF